MKGGEEVEKMRDVRGKREHKLTVEAIEGQRGSKKSNTGNGGVAKNWRDIKV